MLGIEDFAEQLQNDLNTIASGITGAIPFKIFTNLGDYTEAYRVLNDVEMYQFGILRVLPSELVPIKGLQVQNFVFQLECAVNIDRSEKDENGNYTQVVNTQTILNNYAQSMTGTTGTITAGGKSYTVAYAINPCTVSSVTMTTSDYGEVLPIQLTIEVGAVENGVNLNDIDVFIDGEAVYPLSMQATRKRVPNENSFSNKTSTSVGMLQNGFGLDLIVPALYNKIGETILNDIYMGKDNVAHEVSIQYNKFLTYYVSKSDNTEIEEKYAYYSIDGAELSYEVTVTSPKLKVRINGNTGVIQGESIATIDWGDGSPLDDGSDTIHTYSQAGTYTIKYTTTNILLHPIGNKQIVHRQYNYIMTFGNTDHNTAVNTNINPHISLVEGVPHILDYDSKWSSATVTYTDASNPVELTNVGGKVIFWGDGSYTATSGSGLDKYYHKYLAGTYTRRIYSRS